jgi:hypothetical protein
MATTGIFVKMFVAESVILFLFPCPKFILGDLIYIYKKKKQWKMGKEFAAMDLHQ